MAPHARYGYHCDSLVLSHQRGLANVESSYEARQKRKNPRDRAFEEYIPAPLFLEEDDQTFEQKVQEAAERRREMIAECLREEEERKAKKRAARAQARALAEAKEAEANRARAREQEAQEAQKARAEQEAREAQRAREAEAEKEAAAEAQRQQKREADARWKKMFLLDEDIFRDKNDSVAYDSEYDAPLGIAYHYYCPDEDVANMSEEEQAMAAAGHQLKFQLSVVEYRREQRLKAAVRAAAKAAADKPSWTSRVKAVLSSSFGRRRRTR